MNHLYIWGIDIKSLVYSVISNFADPMETSLGHSLANMVAATLACGESCHLWHHMFAADKLLDTHVTGFMVGRRFKDAPHI